MAAIVEKTYRETGYESISPTKFDQSSVTQVASRYESYGGDWVAWTSFVEGMSTLSLDNAMAAC